MEPSENSTDPMNKVINLEVLHCGPNSCRSSNIEKHRDWDIFYKEINMESYPCYLVELMGKEDTDGRNFHVYRTCGNKAKRIQVRNFDDLISNIHCMVVYGRKRFIFRLQLFMKYFPRIQCCYCCYGL